MYKEEILDLKCNSSLYDIALNMGVSESSLRRYLDDKPLGNKTISKIEKYMQTNYTYEPCLENDLTNLLRQYGYKLISLDVDDAVKTLEIYAKKFDRLILSNLN